MCVHFRRQVYKFKYSFASERIGSVLFWNSGCYSSRRCSFTFPPSSFFRSFLRSPFAFLRNHLYCIASSTYMVVAHRILLLYQSLIQTTMCTHKSQVSFGEARKRGDSSCKCVLKTQHTIRKGRIEMMNKCVIPLSFRHKATVLREFYI